ncbi:hypothetical protein HNY73_009757 [Argiope bruennichi]|uniref:Uncharacterized protein n=1 Tax=Argiope bruennichi TaxID=94029 RepID=A0A8T0FAE2_ARGBR|nr:hypothetical protein HNY73_009757 [Argiope bruennichi]
MGRFEPLTEFGIGNEDLRQGWRAVKRLEIGWRNRIKERTTASEKVFACTKQMENQSCAFNPDNFNYQEILSLKSCTLINNGVITKHLECKEGVHPPIRSWSNGKRASFLPRGSFHPPFKARANDTTAANGPSRQTPSRGGGPEQDPPPCAASSRILEDDWRKTPPSLLQWEGLGDEKKPPRRLAIRGKEDGKEGPRRTNGTLRSRPLHKTTGTTW